MNALTQTHPKRLDPMRDTRAYRWMARLFFVLFFVVALASRLLPRSWRPLSRAGTERSLFAEARRAANLYTPFAFMGY